MASTPVIELRSHWWEGSVIITVPSLLPVVQGTALLCSVLYQTVLYYTFSLMYCTVPCRTVLFRQCVISYHIVFITITLFSADIDECALSDKGGCEHKCSNYEGGYYCTCNPGYRLMDDDKGCEGTVREYKSNNQIHCFVENSFLIMFRQP